jgi:hypothetical protein
MQRLLELTTNQLYFVRTQLVFVTFVSLWVSRRVCASIASNEELLAVCLHFVAVQAEALPVVVSLAVVSWDFGQFLKASVPFCGLQACRIDQSSSCTLHYRELTSTQMGFGRHVAYQFCHLFEPADVWRFVLLQPGQFLSVK